MKYILFILLFMFMACTEPMPESMVPHNIDYYSGPIYSRFTTAKILNNDIPCTYYKHTNCALIEFKWYIWEGNCLRFVGVAIQDGPKYQFNDGWTRK